MTDKVAILTRQKEILVNVLEQQPTVFDEILSVDYPEYEALEKQLLGVVTEELPADTDPGPVPGEDLGELTPEEVAALKPEDILPLSAEQMAQIENAETAEEADAIVRNALEANEE